MSHFSRSFLYSLFILVVFGISPSAIAHSTGEVAGAMTDEGGAAIAGARITLGEQKGGRVLAMGRTSSASGPSGIASKVNHLGKVHFANSCSPQVQLEFNSAVAMLHSFQYEFAEKTFFHVIQNDSQCAIAYWGAAMSLNHQLWDPPTAEGFKKGLAYLERARPLQNRSSPREIAYLDAARLLFQPEKHRGSSRFQAYCDAMRNLNQHYPDDDDATAFYALSLLALSFEVGDDSNHKAVAILQRLFSARPEHPGAAHYLIHATDTASLAPLGLIAARSYAKIAPSSPHALHMPAHIFVRLGMWQESIESNLASISAAREATNSRHYDGTGDALHAIMYLSYSYLQRGDDESARRVVQSIKDLPKARSKDVVNDSAILDALYAVETHDWRRATNLAPPPSAFPYAKIRTFWARAIGAARTGNIVEARQNIEGLDQAFANMVRNIQSVACPMHTAHSEDSERVQQLEAKAWLAWAEGKPEEALEIMQKAAATEDSYDVESRTVPAYEMLGDLFLELGQPESALIAYETALKEAPLRLNDLAGAARASRIIGNLRGARNYYAALVKCCTPRAARKELAEAKSFLSDNRLE
ncbi:MAG TPA: hypothetical protein VG759_00640 [Candidatus Angelobacter sp.]|jgi:tetratricopeptide (TPR) repeat protein|nr:hypothetical protein [Candidatus Angelobacter sp.]